MDFDNYLEETALGPLQRTEAEFMYSLIKMLKPNNIVEFGFFNGDSTLCLIEGSTGYDSKITSYDIDYHPKMDYYKSKYENFNYYIKNQLDFNIDDLTDKLIDFIFIDASHNLDINKQTFIKLKPHLSSNCIISVHDTGLWNKKFMLDIHLNFNGVWVDDNHFAHQIHEIEFVKWIKEEYGFNVINFGSENCLRHGVSILQA
jgi:hypothetical protein